MSRLVLNPYPKQLLMVAPSVSFVSCRRLHTGSYTGGQSQEPFQKLANKLTVGTNWWVNLMTRVMTIINMQRRAEPSLIAPWTFVDRQKLVPWFSFSSFSFSLLSFPSVSSFSKTSSSSFSAKTIFVNDYVMSTVTVSDSNINKSSPLQ